MTTAVEPELEDLEIQLLLEGIVCRYGYDFREYAPSSLKRRVRKALHDQEARTISALQEKILHDEDAMRRFLDVLTVDVTDMFRDPSFYATFRARVVPLLKDEPLIRLWHAGCAGGEEVYSMAILLHEEGLLGRALLYATDVNQGMLKKCKEGIYPLATMRAYTRNYNEAGGKRGLSEYYTACYERVSMKSWLKDKIVWAQHNLVSDASFNEFHVILCRNVMIYFNRALQDRVQRLVYESLTLDGVLGLGSKESLQFTTHEATYEALDEREKLFRKTR